MKQNRVIFMGTPIFACSILQALLDEKYQVVGVVSQPDKRVGRKKEKKHTPVKELALSYNIPVLQPDRLKEEYENVLALKPDLIVTCAYGQMVPEALLNAPTFGCINVHASLLPKYRGGAPIHKAIICGEKESGVTIMEMVKRMDAGDIITQGRVPIAENDTMQDLHNKLMVCGANLLIDTLPSILEGKEVRTPQDEAGVTYAYNIQKEEEQINLTNTLQDIYNQIRGLISWPVGYVYFQEKKLKIWKARIVKEETTSIERGVCLGLHEDAVRFAFPEGYLDIYELQPEGKAKMDAKSYMNGSGRSGIDQVLKNK